MSRKNNIPKTILLLIICIICTTADIAAQSSHFVHTVSKGQTLYSISRMYDVTVDDIIALNPDCAQKLAIGYKLKIAQKKSQSSAGSLYHTIKSGETLYRLSVTYKVTPEDICNANPGLNKSNFRAGEVILIPAANAAVAEAQQQAAAVQEKQEETGDSQPETATTHKVEKGETLYSISHKYGITIDELLAANPHIKNNKLKRKSILAIPYSQKELAEKKQKGKQKVIDIGVECPRCASKVVAKHSRSKSLFYSCEKYPECDFSSWDRPLAEKCPWCGDTLYYRKSRKLVVCKNPTCDYSREEEMADVE